MSKIYRKQDALDYYLQGRTGEINIVSEKPVHSQRALAFADHSGVNSTILPKHFVAKFNMQTSIALLASANFGSDDRLVLQKLRKTINNSLLKHNFPFSRLADSVSNTRLFFELKSGNVACKIVRKPRESEVYRLVY